MKRRQWSAWEVDAVRGFYPDWRSDWIARALGRSTSSVYQLAGKLGLHKSDAYLASPDACRLRRGDNIGTAHRFQKGIAPHNKGKRGHASWSPATTFSKGHRPHNWTPIGTVSSVDGYVMVKVREPNVRAYLHELVWASVHDWPRPRGTVIRWHDNDRTNCDPSNLYLVSRADLMRANTVHRYPEPIKQAIRARASLVRKINDHEKNRRPA